MPIINTEVISSIDPYDAIKLNADIIDRNYFNNNNNTNQISLFTSKEYLLFNLQYYIRYSQALEKRIKELEETQTRKVD